MTEEKVIKKSEDGEGLSSTKLAPSNSSLHSSSTGLLKLPYHIVCRQRLITKKREYAAQFNRELDHMIAMKMRAVDGIKLDLLFSIDD